MLQRRKKKLFAIFSFRYDAVLIPDLKKNLRGIVDDYIVNDDRNNTSLWYHEGRTRNALIERARQAGADWVLCIDPDERLDKTARRQIRKLIQTEEDVVYGFHFRELWDADHYRSDGVWNKKMKYILFPLKDGQKFMDLKVHSQWHPQNDSYRLINTGINLYHLKNIDPKNRTARKNLYKKLDPDNSIQKRGYDYLDDETGIRLTEVPARQIYKPYYKNQYVINQLEDSRKQ